MIHTYSVLIMNAKSIECFSQYQPIFADALNNNRISVCKWNEAGTTIDTALPELSSLTDDKEEWRAIIVRYLDDNCMASLESLPKNPFDFTVNRDSVGTICENQVPLVRLTQMLGGVPPLEVEFRAEVVREPHKAPKTIYVPVDNEQREQAHERLVEKYQFDGKLPSSIILITLRKKDKLDNGIGETWTYHKESESSEFWKRNQYPSCCRFIVYDVTNQGPIQKDADDFNFWFSVMLLSVNEIDSAFLQAYRLYTVKTVMNKAAMAEEFQDMVDRLRDVKNTLNREIREDTENQICSEEELPDYRLNIPVKLKLPQTDEREVRTKSFQMLSSGANSDLAIWERKKAEIEEDLVKTVRSAERTLDQTAEKMRVASSFTEDEVEPLNRYQEEDLARETDAIYHNIVRIQGGLPSEHVEADEDISNATAVVRQTLIGRVLRKPAILLLAISMVLLIVSAAVPIIQVFAGRDGILLTLIYVVLAMCVIVGGFALVVLIAQKLKLNKQIRNYNQTIQNAFNKLVENADEYSEYMSSIASHSRGISYLRLSNRKKFFSNEEHSSKYKHIKAINILLAKLKSWSTAYYLNVDFTSKRPETRLSIDVNQSPIESKLYSFESGSEYTIGINKSGMTMLSPFAFASKIELVREELFDDDRS